MSYQVIARKWRPQTFEEITGQEVITQTLRNALEFDRLHHAYLFSGARGVGKTTTARILAKALNCHKTVGKPNLTPCQLTDPAACPSCVEISESRSMDVLEIDAASNTGIDDVRGSIIDNINFNPARDRNKVFIIDEVHQLSKPAFNALLKTLEEPPANVVFIMATTELHKVPETILSRCQEFEFRTIPLQKIFDRLKLIADAEKIDVSDDALRELARSGEGSMRDAQSNFDQVISFSSDKISSADVSSALGFASVEILTKAINAIAGRESKLILTVVDDLIARGHDLRNFCRDLLALFRDLLVLKVAGEDKHLLEGAVFSDVEMSAMASKFSEADLLRFFNSLCETESSLRNAVHPRYVLEVGLVKLIEMRSVVTIESIIERLNALTDGSHRPVDPVVGIAADARADSIEEKKTLKIEPTAPSSVFPDVKEEFPQPPPEPSYEEHEPPEKHVARDESFFKPPASKINHDAKTTSEAISRENRRFAASSFRLPTLPSELIEHIEDKRLDEAFEEKLLFSGDDLLPISGSSRLVNALLGEIYAPPGAITPTTAAVGRSAAAAVPAFDIAGFKQEILPKTDDVELPTLGANPTESELLAFASAHPDVRAAIRIFRAKIVEVKKR